MYNSRCRFWNVYNSSPCPLHQNDEKQVAASRINVAGRNWSWDSIGIQEYNSTKSNKSAHWQIEGTTMMLCIGFISQPVALAIKPHHSLMNDASSTAPIQNPLNSSIGALHLVFLHGYVCLNMWHHQNPFIKIRQRHQIVMHLYGPWFLEIHKHCLYHFTCIQVR